MVLLQVLIPSGGHAWGESRGTLFLCPGDLSGPTARILEIHSLFLSSFSGIRLKDIPREALYREEMKTAELGQRNFNILMSGHGIGGNELLEKM